jgi:uncharacterized membrane-anchored protein
LIPKNSRIGVILSVLAISTAQLCWADQPAPGSAGAQPTDALISALNQKANLGEYAQIEVPKGYRLFDAGAARVLLERMHNPVSPSLVGVLAPENGKWWAVLEFNEIGYVKDLDAKNEDFGAILKAVQSKNDAQNVPLGQGAARILSVSWRTEPKYDADTHSLEWAFLAEGQSAKVVNRTIALFGRRGALNITTVQSYDQAQADAVPLNEVVKWITFKEGQSYADYQTGDKIATGGLKELVMGDQPSDTKRDEMSAASAPGSARWVYLGVGGCGVLGAGLLIFSKLGSRKTRSRPYTNGHAVPALQANGANGHSSAVRQKRFNYYKFYSEMVMQVSGNTYGWASPANGHSRPHVAASATPVATPATPSQALANANLELIACQNNLIEEQRNLMREQTRIIEEKAKLIKEYNHLMEKWSEDLENQFSLKLD